MKRLLFCSLLLINSAASSVEKGDSLDAVIAEPGTPNGLMQRNGKEAREIRAKEQAALEKQKLLCPEDHIVEIGCAYNKTENWDTLPASIRPEPGACRYNVYIPPGYYDSISRGYPCLILESPALWAGVKERIYKEKWIAVILHDVTQGQIGKTMNSHFLAAFDDATERFRISKGKIFLAGRVPSAIFATLRPVAGIILQDPDFRGLEKATLTTDFLRKNPDLRTYALLGNKYREDVIFQGDFIKKNFPKNYIGVYEGSEALLPKPLADGAISWMKKEYDIP